MVEKLEQDGQDGRGAPQTLDLAGLSPEARAELLALAANLRNQETETWLDRFKRRIWGVMKWGGIGVAAVGGVMAGGVYVGKQAMDAFPQAVETAANREIKERVEGIKVAYEELNQAAFALLRTLYGFLLAVKEKATSWDSVSQAAGTLWEGIWADGSQYLTSGDRSPDQILGQIKGMVTADPVLSQKFTAVLDSYGQLGVAKNQFIAAGAAAVTANDTDAKEFYEDYKKEFWDEMLQRGPKTK